MTKSIATPFLTVNGLDRGRTVSLGMLALGAARLPTDAIGTCVVRLQNIVAGSRYRIEVATTGATIADGVAASTTEDVTIDRYASGDAKNDLKIKVRNASGTPAYRPFETQAQATAGTVLVWVSQQLDE